MSRELDSPEISPLRRDFILSRFSGPLAEYLWPQEAGERPDLRTLAQLGRDLGDGLDRLKLAGLPWAKVATLPPGPLGRILADIGQNYEEALALRGCRDRAGLRQELLKRLENGPPFRALAGVEKIVCRWSQRLSPFETDLVLALARHHQVELTLSLPGWVMDENIDHGAGFDLLRTIRQIEKRADLPKLSAFFEPSLEGPAAERAPALAYAAEMLLAPPARRFPEPPEPEGQLCLVSVPTAYHEVEEAARRLKEKLRLGLDPEALAVVVPNFNSYGPLIDDVGRRFGLAFHFRRGESLVAQGPARAVMDLLNLWGSNWEASRVLDLLASPYFRLGIDPAVARPLVLAAGVSDQRAGGGFEENLGKIPDEDLARSLSELVRRLKRGTEKIRAAQNWADFLEDFKETLNDLGWPGELSRAPQSPANIQGADLAAAYALQEELAALAEALADPAAPDPDLSFFRLQLENILGERHLSFDSNPEGRIRVLNYYDLHGGLFEEIFFLGLNERVFPQTGPELRWWPEEFVRAAAGAEVLGRPLWSEAADRYRQEELMLAAGLGQALSRAWLFRHQSDESGRALLPSPLLNALEELWPDGQGGSRLQEEKRGFGVIPPLSLAAGEDEMWAALMKLPPERWPEELRSADNLARRSALLRRRENWSRIRGAARPGPEALGRWLSLRPGHLGRPLISPAFLANYAACPLAFWFEEILGLGDDGQELDEWGRDSEGTFLHGVLEKFISRRLGPEGRPGPPWPGEADYEKCRAELLEILTEEQSALVRRKPLGRRPLWRLRQERLPGLLSAWLRREMSESPAVWRPFRLEWTFGERPEDDAPPWELPLGEEESLFFRGRVDRLDQADEGLKLRDYKLRENPGLKIKAGREAPPRAWPLMIYALAAQSHFGQKTEAWFEIMDSRAGNFRLPVPPGEALFPKGPDQAPVSFPALLAQSWAELRGGLFPPALESDGCDWCSLALLCPHSDQSPEGGEE